MSAHENEIRLQPRPFHVKAGLKTTEFWISTLVIVVASAIVAIQTRSNALDSSGAVAIASAALTAFGYSRYAELRVMQRKASLSEREPGRERGIIQRRCGSSFSASSPKEASHLDPSRVRVSTLARAASGLTIDYWPWSVADYAECSRGSTVPVRGRAPLDRITRRSA